VWSVVTSCSRKSVDEPTTVAVEVAVDTSTNRPVGVTVRESVAVAAKQSVAMLQRTGQTF
jgi:hypothetical protein